MIGVTLACAKHSPGNRVFCDVYQDSVPVGEVEAWYAKQLAEHGWTMEDGKPYCPRHNPSDRGAIIQLVADRYVPLGGSGWEGRIPTGPESCEKIEIRQRRGDD